MTPTQAGALLLYAARIDRRLGTLGKEDAKGWAEVLDGLDFERCRRAVVKHYQESDEVVMPVHIRRLARTMTDLDGGPVEIQPLVSRSGRQLEPHAGEVLCRSCALIHRPDESCEEFARNRRAQLPHPIASVTRSITDEPESPASATHEKALQRARAERGNVPWVPPAGEPQEERPREERDYQHQAGAITAEDLPPEGTPSVQCVCGAVFLDYAAGRTAHGKVFSHEPRSAPHALQRPEEASTGATE